MAVMKAALAKNGRWASAVAALGGFVSDVLQPVAPFAAYLFMVGAVASVVLAVALFARLLIADRAAPALVFALFVTLVAGGLWQMQRAEAADAGIVAELVPAIGDLQKRLGLVAAGVAEIRDKVDRIEAGQRAQDAALAETLKSVETVRAGTDETVRGVARVEDRLKSAEAAARRAAETGAAAERVETRMGAVVDGQRRIEEALGRQAEAGQKVAAVAERLTASVEEMAQSFRTLAGTGGLIPDARTAPELYHNARLSEQRGDALAARQNYLRLAALDVDAVDVWQRFATVVRVQDGRAGAREIFASLVGRARSPAYELVAASLLDDAERRRRIEMFLAMNPDYGPAWYLLADEVSEARLGSQTLSEKRRERDALGRFLSAEAAGTLTRRFLDQGALGDWLESARRRKGVLDGALANVQAEPRAIFTRAGNDWSVFVQLPEPATGFAYRLADQGPFMQAGAGLGTDTRTGRPLPNTNISIPAGAEPKTIDVTYLDLRGTEVGPFRIPFDPMAALVGQQKQALEMTKGSWITFRDYNGLLVYTSHLVSYRCTIEKATYGLDSQPVDKPLPLPACDTRDPFSLPAGETPYFKVPPATRSMTVRLQFRDGTMSETTIQKR